MAAGMPSCGGYRHLYPLFSAGELETMDLEHYHQETIY